jgi:hypothetical protein
MVVTLRLRFPTLTWQAAARVARTNASLAKNYQTEPRDWHGRWTAADGQGKPTKRPQLVATPKDVSGAASSKPDALASKPFARPSNPGNLDPIPALQALLPGLENEFDHLGPKEFSQRVWQFGEWLEREGSKLNSTERTNALAEYIFLEHRLSLWLGYSFKPAQAQNYLLGAAYTLYRGAVNGHIISVGGKGGDPPASMYAVFVAAMANDGGTPSVGARRLSTEPARDAEGLPLRQLSSWLRRPGRIIDRDQAEIVWDGGIQSQGLPWDKAVTELRFGAKQQPPGSKVFDHYVQFSRTAISAKTLNTLSIYYIKNSRKIFDKLRKYVNDVADYNEPRAYFDLKPKDISSREIQLAIPEYTSPDQWLQIDRAISYSKARNVKLVVTRVRQ